MTAADLERRLDELDFLSACEQTMDIFPVEYEKVMNSIKGFQGPRLELALRLKALQIKQGVFLCALLEMERIREERANE